MYTHIYTHTHIYIYTHICVCIYIHIYIKQIFYLVINNSEISWLIYQEILKFSCLYFLLFPVFSCLFLSLNIYEIIILLSNLLDFKVWHMSMSWIWISFPKRCPCYWHQSLHHLKHLCLIGSKKFNSNSRKIYTYIIREKETKKWIKFTN